MALTGPLARATRLTTMTTIGRMSAERKGDMEQDRDKIQEENERRKIMKEWRKKESNGESSGS